MTAAALGINLVEHLRDGDLPRVLALGLRHYLLYAARRDDLGYWAGVAAELKRADPEARVHVRLEARGALDVALDLEFLGAAVKVFGALGDTYRIRNEPNLESPGVTLGQWRDYLVALGTQFHAAWPGRQLYAPAPSPSGPRGVWLDWIWENGNAADAGAVDGVDAHAYGSVDEVADVLSAYYERMTCRVLVTEHNFGAGRQVDLADYALDIPVVVKRTGDWDADVVCLFAWRWSHPDIMLATTVDVADTPLELAIPQIVARQATGGGGHVAETELDRWAADVFRRAGVAYNPSAAIVRYWLDSARRGRYLGRPEGPEHPSEQGIPYQEFAGAVLHWRDGVVREGLPFFG